MTFEFIWSVLAFSFGMSFTPGPNCTLAFSTGLNYGFLSAVPFSLGVVVGLPLMIASVAWGLGEFFVVFPEFYSYIRYAGMAYILYLSWKIATMSAQVEPTHGENGNTDTNTLPVQRPTFLNGVLFQWVNPKAWLLAVTGVTTYVGKDLQSIKLLFLCVSFSVMCLFALTVWTICGKLSGSLIRSSRIRRVVNLFMGLLLASSILTLL